jgi:hypothetical protein
MHVTILGRKKYDGVDESHLFDITLILVNYVSLVYSVMH